MGQINRQSKVEAGPCIQAVLSESSLVACTKYGSIDKEYVSDPFHFSC